MTKIFFYKHQPRFDAFYFYVKIKMLFGGFNCLLKAKQ